MAGSRLASLPDSYATKQDHKPDNGRDDSI